ncbi:MAG: hypothetical protein HEP80_19605 [Dolichospermum sp. UKL201]|jgi:hypothetical protein|nr:MAG: hypothetical protein HEP80_19605 [Dolichospermum sp. UKL201]
MQQKLGIGQLSVGAKHLEDKLSVIAVGAKHLEDKLSVIAKNSSPNASPVQLLGSFPVPYSLNL